MDLALEVLGPGRNGKGTLRFNPCFYGSCSRRLCKDGRRCRGHVVSILVFMDLALEAHRPGGYRRIRAMVSILVFMDLALEVWSPMQLIQYSRVSILVFMDLALEVASSNPRLLPMHSFNPCFYGSCSRSSCLLPDQSLLWKFQSLFLWILLSKLSPEMLGGYCSLVSILVFMDLALEVSAHGTDGSNYV